MTNTELWAAYLETQPPTQRVLPCPESFAFGDHAALADKLLGLVLAGTKTATCGALWAYEAEGAALPKVGEFWIVQNGAGQAVCIIETLEVTQTTFANVDAGFAFDEGEGDRTLKTWREGHEIFFNRTLPGIGKEFSEDLPVVCERFALVFVGLERQAH